MTADQAFRQAEGHTLVKADNASGYKGVSFDSKKAKPYQVRVQRGGKEVTLGSFATAEEAALAYARTPEGQAAVAAVAAPPAPPPMTAEEALRQAEAGGLTLLKADNVTGYKSVVFDRRKLTKPYQANVRRGGKIVFLGQFVTAEEAALR